jgi:hypothetical protein
MVRRDERRKATRRNIEKEGTLRRKQQSPVMFTTETSNDEEIYLVQYK